MRKLSAVILVCYAFLIPFGDAFKLHRWLPLPLAVLLAGGLAMSWALLLRPRVRIALRCFGAGDLLLVGFVLAIGVTLLLSTRVAGKNVNHFIGYAVAIATYYFFVKLLLAAEDTFGHYGSRVRTALAASVALVSVYALLEFADNNFLRLGLTSLVYFPEELRSYNALFLTFTRSRGFMAEAAFLALFLNIVAPISLVYVRRTQGRSAALALFLVVAGAFFVAFSIAGVVFLTVGLIAAGLMYVFDRTVILLPLRSVSVLVGTLVAVLALALALPPQAWSPVVAKLSLSDLSSGSERLETWLEALRVAQQHPFLGTGIGSTSLETGSGNLSFYLTMLKEGGIVTLSLSVLFLGNIFRRIWALPANNRYKYAYAASFVAGVGQYAVISDVWYPWLWLLCALVACESREASLRGGEP